MEELQLRNERLGEEWFELLRRDPEFLLATHRSLEHRSEFRSFRTVCVILPCPVDQSLRHLPRAGHDRKGTKFPAHSSNWPCLLVESQPDTGHRQPGLLHSAGMKWVAVIVLAVIGVLAAIVAIEYFTVQIHSLPSFIPGHRPVSGHYHKRGAVAALIAILAFVGAGVLVARIRRAEAGPAVASGSAADQLPRNHRRHPKNLRPD